MTVEVRPATDVDDVRAVVGPVRPDANVCWCLSYRIPAKENTSLKGEARGERVRQLMEADVPIGVVAYRDGEPAGWAAIAPRSETTFARSRVIPHLDDLPVWSLWCVRVRAGHRGQGLSHALIEGAVQLAAQHGAPVVEAYPLDNAGATVDRTMAYAGLRQNFEAAGFTHAGDTTSRLDGCPRVMMRRVLTPR